jgi:hypothetical protein
MRPLLFASLALVSCNPEFDVHRRVLGPYRVAGVGVEKRLGDDCPRAVAAIWSGQGPYHDAELDLFWTLEGEFLGEGQGVAVCGQGELELEATAPDGTLHRARVDVSVPAFSWTPTREVVPVPRDVSTDSREALEGDGTADAEDTDQVVRVTLEGVPSTHEVRWMTPTEGGHALALSGGRADLLALLLELDDGLVEASSPVAGCPGCILGHLALAIDGSGNNAWGWVEAAYGVEASLVRHEGWLLEADLGEGAAYAGVTLVSDDAAARGLRFENFQALTEEEMDTGLMQLECGVVGVPFELDWLVEGRCTRSQVDGQRVVLALW